MRTVNNSSGAGGWSRGAAFVGKAARRAARPLLVPFASRDLRRRTRAASSREAFLDLAYNFDFLGVTVEPWQARSEISAFLELVETHRPQTVLEIGTGTGGSLYLFARAAAPDALLISVDLHHGQFGGGYPIWRAPLYTSFAGPKQTVKLIRGDSHKQETLDRVRSALGGRDVDLLFIDGDHTLQGVKADLRMYGQLVSPRGHIGFHDIVPGERLSTPDTRTGDRSLSVGDVPEFWSELRAGREVTEFVEDWSQASFGIGVIRRDELDRALGVADSAAG
jgi:cephalosporin hydroxylase